jgi:hypothetical protein
MAAQPRINLGILLLSLVLMPFAASAEGGSNCEDSIIRFHYRPILSVDARRRLQDRGEVTVLQAAEKVQTDSVDTGCTLRFSYVPDADGSAQSARLRRLFRHLLVPPPVPEGSSRGTPSFLAPGEGLIDVGGSPPADIVVPLYPVDPHKSAPIKFLLIFDLSDSGIFSREATHINAIREQVESVLLPRDDLEVWGFGRDWVRIPRETLTLGQLREIVRKAGNLRTDLCLAITNPPEASSGWHNVSAVFTDGEYHPSDDSSCDPPASASDPTLPPKADNVAKWFRHAAWSSYHFFFVQTPFRTDYRPLEPDLDPHERAARLRAKVIGEYPFDVVATEAVGRPKSTEGIGPSIDYLITRVGRERRIVVQGAWEAHDHFRVQVDNHSPCAFDPGRLQPRILPAEPGPIGDGTSAAFSPMSSAQDASNPAADLIVRQGRASFFYRFERPASLGAGSYAVYSFLGDERRHAVAIERRPPVLMKNYTDSEAEAQAGCADIPVYDVPAFFAKDVLDMRVSMESKYHLGPGQGILRGLGLELQLLYPMLLGEDGTKIDLYFRHHGAPWYHIAGRLGEERSAESQPKIREPYSHAREPESGFPGAESYSRSELSIPIEPHYPMRVRSDLKLQLDYDFGSGDRYPVPPMDYATVEGPHFRLVDGAPTLTLNRFYVDNDTVNKVLEATLWFCYVILLATLLRYLFSFWFPLPRTLRGFQADARPIGGTLGADSPFRIRYANNAYHFENSTGAPIAMYCSGSDDLLHSFPVGTERLSASELVELGDQSHRLYFRLMGRAQGYNLQWQRDGEPVTRVTRPATRRSSAAWMWTSAVPDKTFAEICSPAEILGNTRAYAGWTADLLGALLILLLAGFVFIRLGFSASVVFVVSLLAFVVLWLRTVLHSLFWLVVIMLRLFARYLGLKSLSASLQHYRPRFGAAPAFQSALERFRDSVVPAFFLSYPLVYLGVYKGDSSEWATSFGIWVIVGVILLAYMLDRFRTATIGGTAMLVGVSSIPLWIELARAFNSISG